MWKEVKSKSIYMKANYYILNGVLVKNRMRVLYSTYLKKGSKVDQTDIEILIKKGATNIIVELDSRITGYNLSEDIESEVLKLSHFTIIK